MTIYLAGGCFWGVQEVFREMKGVTSTSTGYANSNIDNPKYKQVCQGTTGASEAIQINYNPSIVSLQQILDVYFTIIDPTILNRQGNDRGTQYRTGIYWVTEDDAKTIEQKINSVQEDYSEAKIVVEVMKLENYFIAEDYHQNYLKNNPSGYCHIDIAKHKQ
ncbi:Peptide methionine sulfoxide reductase MsrA [Spironucleus salmonicida]|uniref:peptide-methionine (S)-S-oxide reductase n=1 Tax=Spironucleus salmonicida TaxID=348837 RepID=V6LSD5_9EUKA|nr:Peptide methionine sulfoxide reductase MsrA [Spironucleus salmonicida]|eukprot:EST43659.1 Peptide methionine sulfoxide reductase MsrA [Spironucleus salmonicida]